MLLYSLEGTRYVPIHQTPPVLEAQLHSSFDANLPTLLGVTPLKREFKAGSGRMDTLGFDQHGFPVIIEYKRSPHTSPLMQILSYQSWISAHPEVIEALYTHVPHPLDWRGLRLICVTPSFSQHDILAIEQIQANIDLVEFTLYEGGLMGLQTRASRRLEDYPHIHAKRTRKTPMTFDQRLENASDETAILYHKLIDGLQAKGLMLNAVDDRGTMTWHYFGDQVMRVALGKTVKAQLSCELSISDYELAPRIDDKYLPTLEISKKSDKGIIVKVFDLVSLGALLHFVEEICTLKSLASEY